MTSQSTAEETSVSFSRLSLAHFINGEWLTEENAVDFPLVDPNTGEEVGRAPIASAKVVDDAVAAAKNASAAWRLTTPRERAEYLHRLADLVDEAGENLARLESANVGRPISDVQEDIPYIVDVLRFYAGAARTTNGTSAGQYERGTTSIVLRQPIGVVGLITPWNYPLVEALFKLAPALAAGNTVVLKPSELTPYSTVALAELAASVFPPGVLNVVLGDGSTGAAIVEHTGVGLISLTGDGSTGKKIAASSAATLKRVHLELGGKAPVLVFDDADIDRAAEHLAMAGFITTGQNCTAASRLIVHNAVFDRFVERYTNHVRQLQVGESSDPRTQMGPLVSQRQMERVLGFLERAASTPAKIEIGGSRLDRPGFFVEPTVITGVDQDSELAQREVFGPVVTIQRASSEEQMLQWANQVEYGLAAGIWTRDLDRAVELMTELNFGTVWVNDHLTTLPEMPFGGFGESGYGKALSAESLNDFSQLKHVLVRSAR